MEPKHKTLWLKPELVDELETFLKAGVRVESCGRNEIIFQENKMNPSIATVAALFTKWTTPFFRTVSATSTTKQQRKNYLTAQTQLCG